MFSSEFSSEFWIILVWGDRTDVRTINLSKICRLTARWRHSKCYQFTTKKFTISNVCDNRQKILASFLQIYFYRIRKVTLHVDVVDLCWNNSRANAIADCLFWLSSSFQALCSRYAYFDLPYFLCQLCCPWWSCKNWNYFRSSRFTRCFYTSTAEWLYRLCEKSKVDGKRNWFMFALMKMRIYSRGVIIACRSRLIVLWGTFDTSLK